MTREYKPKKMKAGLIFNKLTAIEFAGWNKHDQPLWKFLCECGQESVKIAAAVLKGGTKSCVCLMPETKNRKRDPNTGSFLPFEEGDGKSYKEIAAYAVWSNVGFRGNAGYQAMV